jgi:hypothetical protein
MSDQASPRETLDGFASSLSYGQRTDLSFKFLTRLDDGEIGDVLAALLTDVGGVVDSGDPTELIQTVIDVQAAAYRSREVSERYRYDDGPFTTPDRSVESSTVSLFTSSGHFVEGDDPQPLGVVDMTQGEAERRIGEFLKEAPALSQIPVDVERERLRVRHGGYDVRGVRRDHNVALPLAPLLDGAQAGVIGSLHDTAYSFVGACAQTRLIKHVGPEWAQSIVATGTDVVLLVPV